MDTLKGFLRGGCVTAVGEDFMLRFCYYLTLFSSGIDPRSCSIDALWVSAMQRQDLYSYRRQSMGSRLAATLAG
jgi:hypothetical protein